MNTNSKHLGIYLVLTMLLTVVATTLRTVACVMHLNYENGFFTDKSLITAANIIISATAIITFGYVFSTSRINLRASFSTGSTYVTTGVLGVATAFLGVRILSYTVTTSRYPLLSVAVLTFKSPATLIGILAAILAFLSIAHHFLNAFIVESKTETRAYFAIATVMFLALYSMMIYLDSTLAIGDSSKLLRLTAFLVSALFFLYEARISLGREMWRIYTSFGLCAAALCAYASIPAIITYYVKDVLISTYNEAYSNISLASIEEYLLLFAMFIFIIARLCVTFMLQEEKENKYIKVLAEYATRRDSDVKESLSRYQKIFAAKQLSIFDLYGGGEIPADTEDEEDAPEIAPSEEEKKEPMISDEAIYESIFGKMPDEEEAAEEEVTEPLDERAPEQIAEELLSSVDDAIRKYSSDKEKETQI